MNFFSFRYPDNQPSSDAESTWMESDSFILNDDGTTRDVLYYNNEGDECYGVFKWVYSDGAITITSSPNDFNANDRESFIDTAEEWVDGKVNHVYWS